MLIEIQMPRLGHDMTQGTIETWFVDVGSEVRRGEVIADVATDKSTVEMESLHSGVIVEIVVAAGEAADVGAVIAIVEAQS